MVAQQLQPGSTKLGTAPPQQHAMETEIADENIDNGKAFRMASIPEVSPKVNINRNFDQCKLLQNFDLLVDKADAAISLDETDKTKSQTSDDLYEAYQLAQVSERKRERTDHNNYTSMFMCGLYVVAEKS